VAVREERAIAFVGMSRTLTVTKLRRMIGRTGFCPPTLGEPARVNIEATPV
jgi:hypothetical protein